MNYSGKTWAGNSLSERWYVYIIDTVDTGNTYTEVRFAHGGLTLEYPQLSSKFDTIRPCGLTVKLLSPTGSSYINFYTNNKFRWRVLLKKNGAVIFEGYINSENFSESYADKYNYFVEFVCSNGFALLDRIKFNIEEAYLITQFDLIKQVINSLGYTEIDYLYIALSTTSPQINIADEEKTLLHYIYVITRNFWDENDEPKSMREVLEATLKPYCAFITMREGKLIITDHNNLLDATTTYKYYDIQNDFAYVGTSTLSNSGGNITSKIMNGFSFEILPGCSQAKVKYSPFIQTDFINYAVPDGFGVTGGTGGTAIIMTGYTHENWGFHYVVYSGDGTTIIPGSSHLVRIQGDGDSNYNDSDYCILMHNTGLASTGFSFNVKLPYFVINNINVNRYYLKLSVQANFRAHGEYGNPENTESNAEYSYFGVLYPKIKIGNLYFKNPYPFGGGNVSLGYWTLDETYTKLMYATAASYGDLERISDEKQSNVHLEMKNGKLEVVDGTLIPLFYPEITPELTITDFCVDGQMSIYFPDYFRSFGSDFVTDETHEIIDCQVFGVNIEIIDSKYEQVKSVDIEKVGKMDELYKDEFGDAILLQGNSMMTVPTEYGALFHERANNLFPELMEMHFLSSFTREELTTNIQNLYLRSILSNYSGNTFQLNGTFEENLETNNLKYFTNTTDPNFVNKQLMVAGMTLNIGDNNTQITLSEICKDNLDIGESYQSILENFIGKITC
jgi:hypothetical protein